MRVFTLLAATALSIGAVACSSSDSSGGSSAKAGTVNPAVAKSATQSAISASVTAVQSNDGKASAGQFMSAAVSAQGIVTPALGAFLASPRLESSLAAGTCDCSGTSCTFTDCSDTGSTTMNGTISWTGGHVLCDLSFKTTQSYPLQLTTKCDLNVTSTSIDGTLSSTGTVDLSSVGGGTAAGAYSWSTSSTFNKVTYASGQPTGGSVSVSATYEIAGQAYSGDATVSFP